MSSPSSTDSVCDVQSEASSSSSIICSEECFKFKQHAEVGFERMEKYFLEGLFTDVTLVTENKRINAHKIVLCAASDYFRAMFTHDLKESSEQEIQLQWADGTILSALVHYCYTGKVDLHENTVELILSTAAILQLQEVVKACCKFLKKQLHPSNCIGICSFADSQGCLGLKEAAHNYTADHFMDVIQSSEFTNLSQDIICKLLSSDDLNVPSEEEIYKALIIWMENNATSVISVSKLLSLIRLPLLDPCFIADHVGTKQIFRSDPACQTMIMEAMMYHLLPGRRSTLQTCNALPRKSTVGTLYAVGGMDASKCATTIEEYNYRANKWSVTCPMSGGRRLQFGAAITDNKLYVVGGRDGLKTLNTVECLDLKTKIWSNLPPMATHRHGLGVAVLEGPLYAVGGHDGWSYLNTVERWDPDLRQWSYVSPMLVQRSTAGIAVLNKKLYVVGGRDGTSCQKSMECYDPHTNKWTMCSPMSKRRGSVGVGVLNGYLYAVGGQDAPASNPSSYRFDCVERYDPKTDTWMIVANMSMGRDAVGVGILGNKLIAVGGYDGQNYLTLVEVYDPEQNEWKQVCPLIAGRAGTCVVTVKPTLQVLE